MSVEVDGVAAFGGLLSIEFVFDLDFVSSNPFIIGSVDFFFLPILVAYFQKDGLTLQIIFRLPYLGFGFRLISICNTLGV